MDPINTFDLTFPVVVIHTTTHNMETRLVRDSTEYSALVINIMEDTTTVGFEVFTRYKLVTKTVEWKAAP